MSSDAMTHSPDAAAIRAAKHIYYSATTLGTGDEPAWVDLDGNQKAFWMNVAVKAAAILTPSTDKGAVR